MTGRFEINTEIHVFSPPLPDFHTQQVGDTHSVQFGAAPGADYLVVLFPRECAEKLDCRCEFEDGVLTVHRNAQPRRIRFIPSKTDGVFRFAEI